MAGFSLPLVFLASAVLLAPLVLAVAADVRVRAFQRQAFGHLAKAARYVRIMGWTIFLYYVGVLAGSFAVGDLQDMARLPMPREGLVIYLRTGAAILGYVFLNLVAKELYLITRPAPVRRPPPAEAPRGLP